MYASEENLWRNDEILWVADDMYRAGHITSEEEWTDFSKMLNDTVMLYLIDKESEIK